MTRDQLRHRIQLAQLSKRDQEIAGEILAKTPEDELDVLGEVMQQDGGLERLIANYSDEVSGQAGDVMEGAPDLIGHAAEEGEGEN